MGEYANYKGQRVKIGTCEDMYYLRYTDRHLVEYEAGNVDVLSTDALTLRFRFPWPDEDDTARPGHDTENHDYDRSLCIRGAVMPAGVEHHSVQFKAQAGYLLSLPCPEGPSTHGLTIHRNGFAGAVHLCQQKPLADGRLVPILKCGGCGSRWRLEDREEIEALVVAIRTEADTLANQYNGGRPPDARARYFQEIADRIAAGAKLARRGDRT